MALTLEAHCSTCTCLDHQQSSFNVESLPEGVRLRRREGSAADGEASTEVRNRRLEADSAATSRSGASNNDEGSVPVQIDTDLSALGDGEELVVSEVVANNLLELNSGNHPKLKIAFQEWEAGFHMFTKRSEVKEAQRGHIRNEIYQLIGFFIVFQGVVYTAVAQAAVLRCTNWWTSFTLSLLASVVTIVAVVQKLSAQWDLTKTIANEKLSIKVNTFLLAHATLQYAHTRISDWPTSLGEFPFWKEFLFECNEVNGPKCNTLRL